VVLSWRWLRKFCWSHLPYAAAREHALTLARDLKHGAVMPGWNWTGWFVVILDQQGHKVDEVSIADI
jgi:hypothetical protein